MFIRLLENNGTVVNRSCYFLREGKIRNSYDKQDVPLLLLNGSLFLLDMLSFLLFKYLVNLLFTFLCEEACMEVRKQLAGVDFLHIL